VIELTAGTRPALTDMRITSQPSAHGCGIVSDCRGSDACPRPVSHPCPATGCVDSQGARTAVPDGFQPLPTTSKNPKELLLGKDGGTPSNSRSQPDLKAGETHIDIAEVIGSIPIAPTIGFLNTNQPVPAVRGHVEEAIEVALEPIATAVTAAA
jgi:hypothetical protein